MGHVTKREAKNALTNAIFAGAMVFLFWALGYLLTH